MSLGIGLGGMLSRLAELAVAKPLAALAAPFLDVPD